MAAPPFLLFLFSSSCAPALSVPLHRAASLARNLAFPLGSSAPFPPPLLPHLPKFLFGTTSWTTAVVWSWFVASTSDRGGCPVRAALIYCRFPSSPWRLLRALGGGPSFTCSPDCVTSSPRVTSVPLLASNPRPPLRGWTLWVCIIWP